MKDDHKIITDGIRKEDMTYKAIKETGILSEFVCSHTDYRFQHLNKQKGLLCPYCHKPMNIITNRIWKGTINKFFHAEIELVCANPDCPFIVCTNEEMAYDAWRKKEGLI